MKLYNLFESVILEEIDAQRKLITESVSMDDVNAAIEGKYNVNILYRDYDDQPPSKRYIQVYNLSKTKAGNDCIRAFQIFGASKKGEKNGYWKIFRLDRIELLYYQSIRIITLLQLTNIVLLTLELYLITQHQSMVKVLVDT